MPPVRFAEARDRQICALDLFPRPRLPVVADRQI
jgi:hypothetical protein